MKIVNSLKSPRFTGIRTFMRLPMAEENEFHDVAIMGIPFDSGTSVRPGCRYGPSALREASLVLKPFCPVMKTNLYEHLSIADYGDVNTIPGYMEESLQLMQETLEPLFKAKSIPVILGGDHSITLAELRASYQTHGPVALLHFDAHSDSIPEFFGKPYNHGTPFYHAIKEGLIIPEKSIQIGIRGCLYSEQILEEPIKHGLRVVLGEELHQRGVAFVIKEALERIGDTPTFVTFDIDFLDASCAPGTGNPEPEGFTTRDALYMMREITKNINSIGMDLVEVLPDRDHADITSAAGVAIIYAFLSSLAYRKKHGLN